MNSHLHALNASGGPSHPASPADQNTVKNP